MTSALPPGIGNPQQAQQATAFIRQQPWYLRWLESQGVTPGEGDQVRLSEEQRAQLMALAIQHGIGFNNKYDMIDENGQIAEEHHKLKKVAIAAAIAGLAVTGLGAAGIGPLAGALGGAGAAASGAGAAGAGIGATGAGIGAVAAGAGGLTAAQVATLAAAGISAAVGAKPTAGMASVLAKGNTAINAGSKIASLLNVGGDTVDALGNSAAQKAQAETNNRFLAVRTDQGGPGADTQAFRNAMRSGLIAKMDPNAAPLVLNGHTLPSLANSDTVDYARTMFGNLRDRQAAGKTPTEFGVPDAGAQETADTSTADTLGKVSAGINTGSKILNLLKLFRTNTDTSGGGGGAAGSGFEGWAPFTSD